MNLLKLNAVDFKSNDSNNNSVPEVYINIDKIVVLIIYFSLF